MILAQDKLKSASSILLIILFSLLSLPTYSQNSAGGPEIGRTLEQAVLHDLIEKGFENVSVTLEDELMIVTYENSLYRNEVRAVKEVLRSLTPGMGNGLRVAMISQQRMIPFVAINLPDLDSSDTEGNTSDMGASLDLGSAWREARGVRKENSSLFRLAIVLHPQIRLQFGDYENVVKSQVNFAPELKTSLWPGMSLSTQLVIPIYNEMGIEGDYWRPGFLTMSQILRLPGNAFSSTAIGLFTENRYGLDMELRKYFANGRLFLGANMGYTGYASYINHVWYYSDINILTALLSAGYRCPRLDLLLSATYGRFLYKDLGWRFDVLRQFGETDIGFFVIRTETGYNGGFKLFLPISPSRYQSSGRFRIGLPKQYESEFRYRGLPRYGIQYDTGNRIDRFMRRLNPDYTEEQMRQ